MSQLDLDLIRQAKREGWKSLELWDINNDNIPDELFELTELEELKFSYSGERQGLCNLKLFFAN